MFLFGMLEDGPRGIQHLIDANNSLEEEADYVDDIDQDVNEDGDVDEGGDDDDEDGYGDGDEEGDEYGHDDDGDGDEYGHEEAPVHLTEVICDVGFDGSPHFKQVLQERLRGNPAVDLSSHNMMAHRVVWQVALEIYNELIH